MSRRVESPPRAGDSVLVLHDLITFRVPCVESGGRLLVVDVAVPPGGGPPPMHTHIPDELFHVIEGEVILYKGDPASATKQPLTVGESGHVAGGVPHTFRNVGDRQAKVLLVFSPGEPMEQFFLRVGHPITDPTAPPEIDLETEVPRVFEMGAQLGMALLEPPEQS